MDQQPNRPAGIVGLSLFFLFGMAASGIAAVMLIFPGTPLDALWRINPRAQEGFASMGRSAALMMSAVCLSCAIAALGLWRRRFWGYGAAVGMLTVNLLGDTISAIFFGDWRTLIGVPIAGLMIAYLVKNRRMFEPYR